MADSIATLSDLESTVLGTTSEPAASTSSGDPDQRSVTNSTTLFLPPSSARQLCALYRKDFLICKWKRHYLISTFELGLVVMLIVTVVRELGNVTWQGPHEYSVLPPFTSIDFLSPAHPRLQSNKSQIAYVPKTDYTEKILSNAFEHANPPPAFHGFANEDEFHKYLDDSDRASLHLAIVFDASTADGSRADTLKYTLRFNATHYNFHTTQRYKRLSEKPRTKLITNEETLLLWPTMNALFEGHLTFHGFQSNDSDLSSKPNIKYFPTARYSAGMNIRLENIGFVISMGCSFFLLFFVLRVVRDKQSRTKEFLRMMGVSDFVYWANLFLVGFTTKAILVLIAWVLICFPLFGRALYSNSDQLLILAVLVLYGVAVILQALLITVPFNSPSLGVIATLVVLFVSMVFSRELNDPEIVMSRSRKLRLSLLPEVGLEVACNIIASWEQAGIGARWANIAENAEAGDDISLMCVIIMMLLSCAVYAFLAFYLDAVLPWQAGIPKHPLFLCQASYWYPAHVEERLSDKSSSSEAIANAAESDKMFERPPLNVGRPVIEFWSIVHRFGLNKEKVLDNLTLNLYRDQITVVIGHNGAGKTTAISILAGLFPPVSGDVYINGHSVRTNTSKARRDVGLCTQHNVLFDELTVEEHLDFFARIKGVNEKDTKAEIDKMLREVNLELKRGVQAVNLTHGMKRKLCIANAMIGGSKILILDEPTTGLDPEGRRQIWTILEQARNSRTILMTTHYMEEADVLGDRVALISHGRLKCVGSPRFLKKAFETGYSLRCAKSSATLDVQPIVQIVKGHLGQEQVHLTSDVGLEFCINVGFPETVDLIQLFRDLEESRDRLGIASMGISITNMEDVFLKVAEMDDQKGHGKPPDEFTEPFPQCARETGWPLYRSQFYALFLKRVHIIRRQWSMPIFLIVLPCLLAGFVSHRMQAMVNVAGLPKLPQLNYSLKSLSHGEPLEGFIQNRTQVTAGVLSVRYAMEQGGVHVNSFNESSDEIADQLLEIARTQPTQFKERWRMGCAMDSPISQSTVLWFNAEPYHVGAAALAHWHTAILLELTRQDPQSSSCRIHSAGVNVSNQPLDAGLSQFSSFRVTYSRVMVFLLIQLATSLLVSPMILFPIEERVSKSKLMQRMSGVHGTVFFGASFIFDFLVILICSCLMTLVLAVYNPAESTAIQMNASAAIWLLLIEYGFTMIKVAYVLAHFFNSPWTGFTAMVAGTSLIAGVIVPLVAFIVFLGNFEQFGPILNYVPQFAVVWGFSNIQLNVHSKVICESLSKESLLTLCTSVLRIDACCQPCPTPKNPPGPQYCYRRKSSFSVVVDQMYALFIVGVIASVLLIALETCLQYCIDVLKCFKRAEPSGNVFPHGQLRQEDADVAVERRKVEAAIIERDQGAYALIAHDLTKDYNVWSFRAVDHISFAVGKNECFGLLGVNGAGKTTIFGMLTGDLALTDGNVYVSDEADVRSSRHVYQSFVGFCPQVDCLLGNMTGWEMLELFCGLRGVSPDQRASLIAQMVALADLEPYANKLTSTYSGGNKRKLAIALAMIANLPVICLDEPTSGIDPTARRKIWAMLAKSQRDLGTAIILSSHSMDECEALCGRMAIIVNGTFRCLGSSQHLKAKFARGFTLTIKIKPSEEETVIIADVCTLMERLFPAKSQLTDIHQNTLTYYIMDPTLRWSELFEVVKELQEQFDLEDAVVSDTSLEQIFLAFAATETARESSSDR